MPNRADQIEIFLANAGWAKADRQSVAGDLSARTYTRLVRNGGSSILLDAPPDRDASTPDFVAMTNWLRGQGHSAPAILAEDITHGLLLLEDLGDTKISALAEANSPDLETIYNTIVDLLVALRHAAAPALPRPDARALADAAAFALDWIPGADPTQKSAVSDAFRDVLSPLVSDASTISLRDLHSDNLMWLPDREQTRRIGLLDYQDAFMTHPVYDLVSLLTDARVDVPDDRKTRVFARYAAVNGDDPETLGRAFDVFSAQRNLRILGIFHRAERRDGKTHHAGKLPRVEGYLRAALRAPDLSRVKLLLDKALGAQG